MGHRRIAAAAIAGRNVVPAIVDDTMDEAEQLQVMLVENLQRVDLTISEEGDGYQGLLDLGLAKADIVRRTGRAKNTVDARLKIAALPEAVRRHVDHHQLTIEEAIAFGEWKDTHPDVWEENLKKLTNPHVMVDVVMGEARRSVAEIERLTAKVTEWQELGHKLVVSTEQVDADGRTRVSALGLSREDHAHCPGAEVRISNVSYHLGDVAGWGTFVCTDAEKYHPEEWAAKDAPAAEWVETDEEREAREARAQIEAEFASAVEARGAWLVAAFMVDEDSHLPIREGFLNAIGEQCLRGDVTCRLPLDEERTRIAPAGPLERLLLGAAYTWSVTVPNNSWMLAQRVRGITEGWSEQPGTAALEYLTLIERLGYPLSDTDQRIKDELSAAVAKAAEAAEAKAAAVDDNADVDDVEADEDPEFDDVPDDDADDREISTIDAAADAETADES
jgi:hypothetical protein